MNSSSTHKSGWLIKNIWHSRADCLHLTGSLLMTCIILMMGSCASLPPNTANVESYALVDTGDTRLGKNFHELSKKSSDESGFLLLSNGLDALASRLTLARDAERSIDVQYYMFGNDLTGKLLVDQLLNAADRGVRVRVLLDDIDLDDRDENLAVFASHQNIALRVFNPFSRNSLREVTVPDPVWLSDPSYA